MLVWMHTGLARTWIETREARGKNEHLCLDLISLSLCKLKVIWLKLYLCGSIASLSPNRRWATTARWGHAVCGLPLGVFREGSNVMQRFTGSCPFCSTWVPRELQQGDQSNIKHSYLWTTSSKCRKGPIQTTLTAMWILAYIVIQNLKMKFMILVRLIFLETRSMLHDN